MRKAGSRVTTSEVISQLRLPLIVLVTFAHSYGAVRSDFTLLSGNIDGYELLKLMVSQTLVKVVVPVFYIVSGYLFFANVSQWNVRVYRQKLLRRAKTLLLPYVVWNLLMAIKLGAVSWTTLWVYWTTAGVQTDWLGNQQLMTAPANMPLWFLRDLIVISLLSPIVFVAVRYLGRWLLAVMTVWYLSGVCAFTPGLSAYAVMFFTLGAYCSINKQELTVVMRRTETAAYLLSAVLAVAMLLTWGTAVFSSLMLAFRLAGAVAVINVGRRLMEWTPKRIPTVVSRSSYFLYLAHYVFFMSFIDEAIFSVVGLSNNVALSIHYLLAPLLKAAILIAVYAVGRMAADRLRRHR